MTPGGNTKTPHPSYVNLNLYKIANDVRKRPKLQYSDSVHMHNHKRESCHTEFNPKLLKEKFPHANTMICEAQFNIIRYYILF